MINQFTLRCVLWGSNLPRIVHCAVEDGVTKISALATQGSQEARRDPASIPYPPTLPVEIALRQQPPREICRAYGIDQAEWDRLRFDPIFIDDVKKWLSELQKEGMSFKVKARLQSEELLKTTWQMIHDQTGKVPAAVQADLAKFTIRAAGLDGSKDQGLGGQSGTNLQINLILG